VTTIAALPNTAHPKRWAILAVLLAVECMDILDSTIVNVALPTIQADLHATETQLQWIVGGYALTYAVGLVTSGRLGDVWGRRRMFLLGAVGFAVTSALCGLAPSAEVLIAMRFAQGAFAAVMVPQGFGIIREVFPTDELPKVFGLFGPVIGLGAMLGPIVGGLLTDADLLGTGWRLIFYITVPMGALAFVAGRRLLPESKGEEGLTLDIRGSVVVIIASGLLIYPLIQGRELDWPAWTFVMMAAGLALFAAFAWVERRNAGEPGRTPLVSPTLFSKRAFTSGILMTTAFFAALGGLVLIVSLYLQIGLGFSAIHTGLTFISLSIGTAIGAGLGGGVLVARIGRHCIHVGLVVMIAAMAGFLAILHGTDGDVTSWDLVLPLTLAGAGMGLVIAPLFSIILAGVDDHEIGSGSGVLNAMQQLGNAVGVAVLGTIFFSASGMLSGLETVSWTVIGISVAVGAMTFLLPLRARADEELMH
jgi:EmrB/QacA subfamily drug resistance transporter